MTSPLIDIKRNLSIFRNLRKLFKEISREPLCLIPDYQMKYCTIHICNTGRNFNFKFNMILFNMKQSKLFYQDENS